MGPAVSGEAVHILVTWTTTGTGCSGRMASRRCITNGVRANDGISLHVAPGEVYGLLGPNGAGKTTLVKQVIGLLKPTSGQIWLGGHDLVADPAAARQLCSYLPQAQVPIDSFRAREAIVLVRPRAGRDSRRGRASAPMSSSRPWTWANGATSAASGCRAG